MFRAILLTMTLVQPVVAAPTTKPDAPLVTADQRAADDAVQNLIDVALSLHLLAGRTPSMLLAGNPDGESALRQAVLAAHQLSRARRLADGSVEVDAWLPAAAVTASLQEIAAQDLPGLDRKHLAPAEAAAPVLRATGRYRDDGRSRDDRPGWRHCDARQIALVQTASEIDFRARLLDHVGRLRLTGLQTVGDLMRQHPRFRDAVHQHVNRLKADQPVLEPTGLCRRTIRITRAEVIELLARAATESAERIRADFSRVTFPALEDPLTICGFGVAPPPPRARGDTPWVADDTRPDWADEFLTATATGRAPADAGDEPTRRALAAKAARIEAARQLWLKLEALPLPEGDTIAAYLARDPRAVAAFAELDQAMQPTGAAVFGPDGTATVTVGISLQAVWRIARDLPRAE